MSDVMATRARDRPDLSGPVAIPPIDLRPLLGRWVNYDENSTGISHVEFGSWEGIPTVRVFGGGLPAPIDWGEAAGAVFACGVGGHELVAFRASFDFSFAYVQLTCYLNKRLLTVSAYSVFTDQSGRANYFQRDQFYRP